LNGPGFGPFVPLLSTIFPVKDPEARPASDLALAVDGRPRERRALVAAADLISAIVEEGA